MVIKIIHAATLICFYEAIFPSRSPKRSVPQNYRWIIVFKRWVTIIRHCDLNDPSASRAYCSTMLCSPKSKAWQRTWLNYKSFKVSQTQQLRSWFLNTVLDSCSSSASCHLWQNMYAQEREKRITKWASDPLPWHRIRRRTTKQDQLIAFELNSEIRTKKWIFLFADFGVFKLKLDEDQAWQIGCIFALIWRNDLNEPAQPRYEMLSFTNENLQKLTTPTGEAKSTPSSGEAWTTTPTGGAKFTTPPGGAKFTTPTGGAKFTTKTGMGAMATKSTPAVLLTCNIAKQKIRAQTSYFSTSPVLFCWRVQGTLDIWGLCSKPAAWGTGWRQHKPIGEWDWEVQGPACLIGPDHLLVLQCLSCCRGQVRGDSDRNGRV